MSPPTHRPVHLGPYEITGKIAAGGMATVYAAQLERPGGFARPVALKVIHRHLLDVPKTRERFIDEARFASRVRHPNVVCTVDVGEEGGLPYLVLERIDGLTLRQLQQHHGRPLPPAVAARVVADAACGAHALHQVVDREGRRLGVVHRDLSPHNLMVDHQGRTILIDLGLAKAEEESEGTTRTAVICGKLPYMSPEQSRLDPLDARSDVFSLGTILFELCTGELPFGDSHTTATLERLRKPNHATLAGRLREAGVPGWLGEVILTCLQADPGARFPDAASMAEAIEQGMGHAGLTSDEARQRLAELVDEGTAGIPSEQPLDDYVPWQQPEEEPLVLQTGPIASIKWIALGAAAAVIAFVAITQVGGSRQHIPMGGPFGVEEQTAASLSLEDGGSKPAAVAVDKPRRIVPLVEPQHTSVQGQPLDDTSPRRRRYRRSRKSDPDSPLKPNPYRNSDNGL